MWVVNLVHSFEYSPPCLKKYCFRVIQNEPEGCVGLRDIDRYLMKFEHKTMY